MMDKCFHVCPIDTGNFKIQVKSDVLDDVAPSDLVTSKELEELCMGNVPRNTRLKRLWAMKHFNAWREKRNLLSDNEKVPIEEIEMFSIDQLNWSITRFICEVRNHSCKPFRPKTQRVNTSVATSNKLEVEA